MPRKSILVVEDDEVIRTLIKGYLEREYNVIEASGYLQAINKLTNPIDLALIDYALQDGDGFELSKIIRQTKPQMPIIIMTAYGTETIAVKALRAGVTDYIKKPMKLAYLMKRISELLEEPIKREDFEFEHAENRKDFMMDGIAWYLEENYTEDFTLDKLAGRLGINKFSFCRSFKGRFGQGFRSYLNNVRAKNAAELLKNYNLNITEIAYAVGYKSFPHFERVFKKAHGISPREYRKHLTKKP